MDTNNMHIRPYISSEVASNLFKAIVLLVSFGLMLLGAKLANHFMEFSGWLVLAIAGEYDYFKKNKN
jgi:hypothetical protein